jgi:hypothetical protein
MNSVYRFANQEEGDEEEDGKGPSKGQISGCISKSSSGSKDEEEYGSKSKGKGVHSTKEEGSLKEEVSTKVEDECQGVITTNTNLFKKCTKCN